jgi:hypothetical protein
MAKVIRTADFTTNIVFGFYEVRFYEDGFLVDKKEAGSMLDVNRKISDWESFTK